MRYFVENLLTTCSFLHVCSKEDRSLVSVFLFIAGSVIYLTRYQITGWTEIWIRKITVKIIIASPKWASENRNLLERKTTVETVVSKLERRSSFMWLLIDSVLSLMKQRTATFAYYRIFNFKIKRLTYSSNFFLSWVFIF